MSKQPLGETRGPDHLPIVAIDPPRTRATMTTRSGPRAGRERRRKGGWNAIVAIADVSFYVRPGSELDREARARGNSVYFPDRVVPMLPEELSADICSLKEGEDRAAMACHLEDREGRRAQELALHAREGPDRRQHRLRGCAGGDRRGRRRSGSRFARPTCFMPPVEGRVPQELVDKALKPLWACWRALVRRAAEARSARARPARAAGDARREGADHLDRAARPARRAPAGRGLS